MSLFLISQTVLVNEKSFEQCMLIGLFFLRHFLPRFNTKFHSEKFQFLTLVTLAFFKIVKQFVNNFLIIIYNKNFETFNTK